MDSTPTHKTVLNLPTEMSKSTLRLDLLSSSFCGISTLSLPSKTSTCSDRFIPYRSSSRLHQFGMNDKSSPVKDGENEAYQRLLRSELFGSDFDSFGSPAGGGGQVTSSISPSKNMLRFKTEHSGPNSPYSPSRCTAPTSPGSSPPPPTTLTVSSPPPLKTPSTPTTTKSHPPSKSPSTTPSTSPSSSSLDTGVIVGIAIGAVARF